MLCTDAGVGFLFLLAGCVNAHNVTDSGGLSKSNPHVGTRTWCPAKICLL
ncbi:hypothetical protein M758_7G069900 [Ceratodon purpureus]|nr:hypothetical protein M758_7G069900 [Ceratodon purpureus]